MANNVQRCAGNWDRIAGLSRFDTKAIEESIIELNSRPRDKHHVDQSILDQIHGIPVSQ